MVVKMVPLTIRVTPDTIADIDAYAQEHFPQPCPKCKSSGQLRSGAVCPQCGGVGNIGMRAEALRFLLQFSLGAQADPAMRAMAAVYDNVAPILTKEIGRVAHVTEKTLKENIKAIIATGVVPGADIGPPSRKRKKKA